MDPGSHIKSLLQFQLGSDNSSVLNLPYCLSTLTSECFVPSTHIAKWTSRISSLMHAKEPGARWAGLCLAYKTSLLSQAIMIDCAQSWVVIALPALSRNESLPVLKAALRLLEVIFTTATDINEFQRQVTVPNVLKCTTAILSLADSRDEQEIKMLCMKALTHLVTLYPTTHRASSANLSSFCLRYLSGSAWTNINIVNSISEFYSVLHLTGGKVGSANLWRKSVDQTLSFGWDAFMSLRMTFNSRDQHHSRPSPTGADPQVVIPLSLGRLRNSVMILCHLLSTVIHRPVHVPIGGLVKFSTSLLCCSKEDKIDGFVDPLTHSMEVAVAPEIVSLGCELLICLARRFSSCLVPHLGKLVTILVVQLEQKPNPCVRLKILRTLESLLEGPYVLDSPSLCGRIVKVVLPSIMRLVTPPTTNHGTSERSSNKTKSGKKRARNFEGEEILKKAYEIICPTPEDREAILISVDVLGYILTNPTLPSAMASIVTRVMLALLVTLPRSAVSSLSPDPNFAPILTSRVQALGFRIGSGTTSVMSKALPFVIEAGLSSQESEVQRNFELLLHPRLPPLVRTMPHLESLSVFRVEESNEEAASFSSLVVVAAQSPQPEYPEEDVAMEDIIPSATVQVKAIEQQQSDAIRPQEASKVASEHKTNDWNQTQQGPESQPIVLSSTTTTTPLISNFGEGLRIPAALESIHLKPLPLLNPASQDEQEEEMPAINMSSDSEIEEEV